MTKELSDANGVAWQCTNQHGHISPGSVSIFLRSSEAEIQQSAYLVPAAIEALESTPTLWLRGIPSLPLEEAPLSLQYWAFHAGPDYLSKNGHALRAH